MKNYKVQVRDQKAFDILESSGIVSVEFNSDSGDKLKIDCQYSDPGVWPTDIEPL